MNEKQNARSTRPPRPGGPARPTWPIYLLLALFALALIFRPERGTTLPYSEFKRRLAHGDVAEVELGASKLRVTPTADRTARWVVHRVEDPELVPTLDAQGVAYRGSPEGDALGSLLLVWILPTALLVGFWWLMLRRLRPGAGVMSIGRARVKLLVEEGTGVTFEDVAGADEALAELREIVDFLSRPERFRRIGARIPKGVLLVGPPGTGKTLLARAVAGEAKVPFFSLTGSDFVEMFVGVGAARVRDLFTQAQAKAPCIIFIDELDAVGKTRGPNVLTGHDEREQTLNQLLAEMDGFDARRGLMIMAATNRPEILDAALLRAGRFDRQVLVDRPDVRGREAILRVHARGVRLSPSVDLKRVASLTPGLVGADLANLINESALLAARRGEEEVAPRDMNEAIERTLAGLEKRTRLLNPKEREIVAHHESGHALLAELLPSTDRVHKVSMIPRGTAALGYTLQLPLEDRYLMTEDELFDKLTVLMGGRAAEKLVFGQVSTGAADDLERATALARRMVAQFGMSRVIGPQSLQLAEGAADARFLPGVVLGAPRAFSEQTQRLIDAEARRLLDSAFDRATRVLEGHRPLLLSLARRLAELETLEGEALRVLLAPLHPEAPPPEARH